MAAATVPAVYAAALLELADEHGRRQQVVDDAAGVVASFLNEPALLQALRSPALGREKAKAVLRAAFSGKVADEVRDLLLLLVDRGRLDQAVPILEEVVATAARQAGRLEVEAASAVPVDAANRERLERVLRQRFGDNVSVAYAVDPSLKGGLTLRYGDVLVDSSVRRHLDAARSIILNAPVPGNIWDGELSAALHA